MKESFIRNIVVIGLVVVAIFLIVKMELFNNINKQSILDCPIKKPVTAQVDASLSPSVTVDSGSKSSEKRIIPDGMDESEANRIMDIKVSGQDQDALSLFVQIANNKLDSACLRNYAIQHIARWVEEYHDLNAFHYLSLAASADQDCCVRDIAIFSIARLARRSGPVHDTAYACGEQIIPEGLTSTNTDVRIASVRGAQYIPSKAVVSSLESIAGNIHDVIPLRVAAIDVLGILKDKKIVEITNQSSIGLEGLPPTHPLVIACARARLRVEDNQLTPASITE